MLRHLIRGSTTASDESLLVGARSGDKDAFAMLWERHARSGLRVARQFTSLDADDLVAEAFVQIYRRVLAGGGPEGSFRPYLYTTIRNLACRWGRESEEVPVDDLDRVEDPLDDPAVAALDRSLVVRAFRSLPDRWQSVLWYTEVEGMDPREVAPLLGLTPNSVAALSYRAREGLRTAWLQAHISDDATDADCRWAIAHLGGHARHGLSARESGRLARHLRDCARCSVISEEVDEVGAGLALVLLPLLLGGVVGGAVLAAASVPSGAAAAELLLPAVPPAFPMVTGTGFGSAAAGSSLATAFGTPVLAGGLALVVALSGGLAVSVPPSSAGSAAAQSGALRAAAAQVRAAAPAAPTQKLPDATGTATGETRPPLSSDGARPLTDPASALLPGVGVVHATVETATGVVHSAVATVTGSAGPTVDEIVDSAAGVAGSFTAVDSTVGGVTGVGHPTTPGVPTRAIGLLSGLH